STGYAVGSGATVISTTDGGATWLPLSVPVDVNPYFENVCFLDSARGWCVGLGGTILHTGDAGATWERQISGTLFGLEWVKFTSPAEGWAGGYGGTILHTTDAGETWVSQKRNLPPEAITLLRNVFGTLEGTTSDEEVIVCGHFDSVSEDPMNRAPGADDNATGTAGVVEAARVLSRHRFEKTIRFICFSGEEIGLQGSGAYAPEARVRGDDIAGVINLDMIGYIDEAPEDIDLIGNAASEWLVDFTAACAETYVPGLPAKKIIDPTYLASDHASFWNSGYRALLAIEDGDIGYPYYHTTADTLGNVTMSLVENTTKMALAALAQAAVPDTTALRPEREPAPEAVAGRAAGAESSPGDAVSVWPNPVSETASVCFSLVPGGRVDAAVYDVGGRLIRRLAGSHFAAGPHEVVWDGRDESGRKVSAGIYFVRIDAGNRRFSSRVVLLR
ncbi:MAG: M20/M25/M40 family metallo-hydrolase, partial [bacterium]